MSEQEKGISNVELDEQKNEFQISDVIAWTLSHKKFFLISLIVCLSIGILYVARCASINARQA